MGRGRLGADLEGHGRLQRLRQGRPWRRAQQTVFHGGPSGGECRRKGVLRVQGRGESSPLSTTVERQRLRSRPGSTRVDVRACASREHARIYVSFKLYSFITEPTALF